MPAISEAVATKAAAIQSRLNAEADAVSSDGSLTPQGRTRALAQAYTRAKTEMDALQQSWSGNSQGTATALSKDLFGAQTVAGADAISIRDASDRASQLEDPQRALDILEAAENNGDEVLARAIAQHAWNQRSGLFGASWAAVVSAYAASRPDVAQKMQELEDATRADVNDNFVAGYTFYLHKPGELGNLSDYAIQGLADAPLPKRQETQHDRNAAITASIQRSQGYDWTQS